MILCHLRTNIIEIRSPIEPTEGGYFEVAVHIDEGTAKESRDPRGYCFKEIAIHLKQAIIDTTVPKEHWVAEFPKTVQKMFNLPERVPFG